MSSKGKLSTAGVLITGDGKRINLGQMDRKLFGKVRWTPRLWFYKYYTYRRRLNKANKGA